MEEKILPRPAWMSIVGGILSFFIVCTPFLGMYLAVGCAIGGLLSGLQGLKIIKSDPNTYTGTGVAIVGIVISSISTVIFFLLLMYELFGIFMGFLD